MIKNSNNLKINFDKVYLYKTKPEIIPFLKRFIGFLVLLTLIIHFIGYGLTYFFIIKKDKSEEKLSYYFLNKLLILPALFIFISIFIMYKNFKSFKSLQEKYYVSIGWNILIIIIFTIFTVILWTFKSREIIEELQKEKWKIIKNIDFSIKLIITILLFLKSLIIIIQFLLKPKLDIKKVQKLNIEIMKKADAALKGKEYIVDESIYQ